MSFAAPLLAGSSPLSAANPFGGHTAFGFEIPQGDPGAIEGAGHSVKGLGGALSQQGSVLRAAGEVALGADGGWRGTAATAFAGYSNHVAGVYHADAGSCDEAASALTALAQALTHAQAVTRQALAECEAAQGTLTTQQGIATTAGQTAATAHSLSVLAPDPASRSAYHQQATTAQQQQTDAQSKARIAQGELQAAQRRGQTAADAYEHEAKSLTARLMAAGERMRTAPQLAGGPPVPVKVTPGDVAMAKTLLNGMTLATAAQALSNPAKLRQLACDLNITPGTALQFLQDYRDEKHWHDISANENLDGSALGVIPGARGFANGAWSTISSTGKLVWQGVTNPTKIPGATVNFVEYVANHPGAFAKSVIDYNDFAHGRISRGLGVLVVGLAGTKGVGEGASAGARTAVRIWEDSPGARPTLVETAGKTAGALGVPHAGDVAGAVKDLAGYSPTELIAAAKSAPVQAGRSADRTLVTVVAAGTEPVNLHQLIDGMSKLPAEPKIIVVPREIKPTVTYHRPAPQIVRRVPGGR